MAHDTEFGDYTFTVKESATGKPFIALEPVTQAIPSLKNSLLTLHLDEKTTIQQAEEISRYLDEHIRSVGYTKF
jgi:hypothetical protein